MSENKNLLINFDLSPERPDVSREQMRAFKHCYSILMNLAAKTGNIVKIVPSSSGMSQGYMNEHDAVYKYRAEFLNEANQLDFILPPAYAGAKDSQATVLIPNEQGLKKVGYLMQITVHGEDPSRIDEEVLTFFSDGNIRYTWEHTDEEKPYIDYGGGSNEPNIDVKDLGWLIGEEVVSLQKCLEEFANTR